MSSNLRLSFLLPLETVAVSVDVQSPLELAILRHAIIPLEYLQRWKHHSEATSFCSLLLLYHRQIPEDRWIEMIASYPGLPRFYPTTQQTLPSSLAFSHLGRMIGKEHFAVILQNEPLLIVALLDPFSSVEVKRRLEEAFPKKSIILVASTPHVLARLLDKVGESTPKPAVSPQAEEQAQEWASYLHPHLPPAQNTSEIVYSLWSHSPPVPVVTPFDQDHATIIDQEPECLLIRETATNAWIASLRPFDASLRDRLNQRLGRRIHLLAIGPREFNRICGGNRAQLISPEVTDQTLPLVVHEWESVLDETSPEIRVWDNVLSAAIKRGASDLHLDPKQDHIRVRFRLDGELVVQAPLPRLIYPSLLRRAKILSGMRHDKSGLIQDGATYHEIEGQRFDLRFSVSVVHGGDEALVIRIFSSKIPTLDELLLPPKERNTLHWALQQENGLVIATGPTGSGKTTTLYACLQALAQPHLSLVTIEQPVEKYFPLAKQIDVREREGSDAITFSSALRSVLRQDPDIIMVGEIRDPESAQISVQASLTGHLVLTTVHANNALGVIERLSGSFAVDRQALGQALKLALAQRLIPRLCPHCRVVRPAINDDLSAFPEVNLPHPITAQRKGCPKCRGTGRSGRVLIMEMLPIDHHVATLIGQRANPAEIRQYNQDRGYTNLLHKVTTLLFQGEIEATEANAFLDCPR